MEKRKKVLEMTRYMLFETKTDAQEYQKKHGGIIIDFNSKYNARITMRQFYHDVVNVDTKKYNFAVEHGNY